MRFPVRLLLVFGVFYAIPSLQNAFQPSQYFEIVPVACEADNCLCGEASGRRFECPEGMHCAKIAGYKYPHRCTNWTGLVIAPPVCPLSPPVFPPSTDKPQTTPVPASTTTTTAPPHTPATSKTEEASAVPVQVLPLVQTQSSLAECSKLFLSWPYLVFGTLLIIFAVVFTVLWCLLFRMKTLLADELKVIKDENLKHKNDIKDAKEELTVVSDALADNVDALAEILKYYANRQLSLMAPQYRQNGFQSPPSTSQANYNRSQTPNATHFSQIPHAPAAPPQNLLAPSGKPSTSSAKAVVGELTPQALQHQKSSLKKTTSLRNEVPGAADAESQAVLVRHHSLDRDARYASTSSQASRDYHTYGDDFDEDDEYAERQIDAQTAANTLQNRGSRSNLSNMAVQTEVLGQPLTTPIVFVKPNGRRSNTESTENIATSPF